MPSALWQATLSNTHEGRQGIVRTKQMVREKVWWPGIMQQVETMVKACLPCQSVAGRPTAEPLRPTEMPDRPWQEVHIDLCGPFPSGESLLVCEDACTRWPEVVILRSTTSAAIIGHLRKIFAAHGLPEKVVTDNEANLVSGEFEHFLELQASHIGKLPPTGHRPMQKLRDSTRRSRKRFALPMLKARTGPQQCLHSCLTIVRCLTRQQACRRHFYILDEKSEPKYPKLRHRCLTS